MPFPVPSLPISKPQNTGMPVTENLYPRKGSYAAAEMWENQQQWVQGVFRFTLQGCFGNTSAFQDHEDRVLCFANHLTRKKPKLFSAHPLMSSWRYSRHTTQVGLLSRHFRFFDAGPFGANSECVKDQQHYRSPALADLQTGAQIPLWPQGKGNFTEIFKGKI